MTTRGRKCLLVALVCLVAAVAGCGGGSGSSGTLTLSSTTLPSGDAGNAYSTALSAAGGTLPYTWSITAGALPAGLNFGTSSGTIAGVLSATALGKSNFTVQVTDSSTPVETSTASFSILVGNLSITTTSLPAGSLGTPYSATLTATGGTAPLTWSISSGTLPAPLTLNSSTGAITGTPANGGRSTFTVQVTDSESPAVSVTANFTISVSPLTLLNNSLPNGLQGTPYSLALDAVGGTPPYTWSLVSGAFPGGLSLNTTTGTISGTPTGFGTSNFTIHVADAESPAEVATVSLSLTIEPSSTSSCAGAPLGNESLLSGNYALFAQGFQGGGSGTPVAMAASFAANGASEVTGGDIDVSSSVGSTHYTIQPYSIASPVSIYTVGLDPTGAGNLGCVMLTTSAGTTTTPAGSVTTSAGTTMAFRFSLGGVTSGVASKGKIIEFDDTSGAGTIASGIMALQDTTSFSASKLSSSYAFGLDGEMLTGTPQALVPLAEGGSFSVSSTGGISNAFADVDLGDVNSSALTGGSGSVASISATDGRGTASFSVGGTTFSWVVYLVNAKEFYLVSTAAQAGGRALATSRSFSQASLSGNYIAYTTGISTCNGTPCADVNLGLLTLNGTAASGPLWDYNVSAGESMSTIAGGSYAVASPSGRVTFTNVSSNSAVSYLVSPAVDGIGAIIVGTDTGAHFGFATLQVGTSVPSEQVIYGTRDPRSNTVRTYAGTASVAASGALTGTEDSSSQNGNPNSGLAVSRTVSLIANGTGSAASAGGSNIAVTDGSRIFWFDYGGAPPVITVAEPQ